MLAPLLLSVFVAPPNVLFIAVDDLRPDIGCYGVEWADTPNMDRLADRGVRFSRHYVQVATCGASRFALLTGRSPAATGATGGNSHFYDGKNALSQSKTDGAQTFPELFRRNGYQTVSIGKISHTVDNKVFAYNGSGDGRDEVPFAWSDMRTPYGSWERGWGTFFAYPDGVHREDGNGHIDLMDFTVESDDDLPDGQIAAVAVKSIEELAASEQPFLLAVGFYKPHLPWVAPRQDWDAAKTPPAPPVPGKQATKYGGRSGEFYKYDMPYQKPLDTEGTSQCRRAYAACVRYTDRQVGRLLDALDASDEAENTVIVLWGDHGWQLGDWTLWGKHTPLERANHSPLIITAPGTPSGVCETPTETIDVYPTLVELCHLSDQKTQHPLNGESLLQRLHDPAGALADADIAVSYWGKAISVRSKNYRAIGTPTKSGWKNVELYEPESTTPAKNVAGDHAAIAEELLLDAPQ